MEVVKFEYENSPGFITSPNTTNSSFKSDLAGFVEGTKSMTKKVENKLRRLTIGGDEKE